MKKVYLFFAICALFLFASESLARECKFSWLPNDETNLVGYRILYGVSSRMYTEVADVGLPDIVDGRVHTTLSIDISGQGFYFACIAYDTEGNHSHYSNEVYWKGFAVPTIISITKE